MEALGDLTHGATGDEPPPQLDQPAETYLVQLSRWLMACEFQIFLTADHSADAPEAAIEALDLVDELEDQLTVYRDHSEISRLNQIAALRSLAVERRLFELLRRCVKLFHETDGAFDVTAGPLTKLWGFFRREGRVPGDEEIAETLKLVDSRHLQLNEADHSVKFAIDGVQINLGGIGKGYALDRAAAQLRLLDVNDFLFHGGRSSVLAAGSRFPQDAESNPWRIGIGNPLRPDHRLGYLALRDRAMSTSGSATQSFHHQGKRMGHILDPRTGLPAAGVLSVTVLARDAAMADALSTALYVMGPDQAEDFCAAHADIAALIVLPTKSIHQVEVLSLNMPEDTWEPLS